MPLVNQIMATDGYQKIMEGIGKASPIMINPETYDYSKANTLVDVLYKFRPGTWDTLADKFPDLTNLIDSTKNSLTHLNTFLGINIAETPGSMFMTATKNFSIGLIIVALAIPVLSGLSQWISAKPVSYTHLDVYKRQLIHQMMKSSNRGTPNIHSRSFSYCF